MDTSNDVKHLRPCISTTIDVIDRCLSKFESVKEQPQIQPQTDIKDDTLLHNSQLHNNIYTFSLGDAENELLDTLTSDIQAILNQHLPHLTQICSNYLLDFLHTYHYDREKREFTSSLAMGDLHSFKRELKGLLASTNAFPAAYAGDLKIVKEFIKQYPTFKDKPGLWETTLLYSAARNNHLHIVKYLIEEVHCSVNAQNQREVVFALDAHATDYTPRPTAGSTALHGACFNNHLNIVKYLVEHGADYFIQNQAHETPLMNGKRHVDIKKYFQDYLVLGYVNETSNNLPDQPIMDNDDRPIRDCMWEYKPFQDPKWYRFSPPEAEELQKALVPSEQFQQQVYLKLAKGLYTVSMIEFYRSGRHDQDPQKNMAWIRCRGSSILNFDCSSIWQIMLIQHQTVNKYTESIPSLKAQHLPTMHTSRFKLQLNTWYSCDAKTSSLLDDSMNYRRKLVSADIPFVGDELKINLQTFEFSNNAKTILGYIRWIPKLIANNEDNDKKIVPIDNYQPMTANMQPIPLTTKRLRKVVQMKNVNQQQKNDLANQDDDDDSGIQIAMATGMENNDEGDDDDIESSNNKKQVG
jgi:hypothetical protein